jgi:hypothetical protein
MSDHSLLSASSAERWLACPISVTATDESRTSEAAAEGTALHAVSETVLRGGAYPEIGSTIRADGFDFEYDEHRHRDTSAYVDYVRSLPWVNGYNVEAKVHYGQMLGTPHNLSFGTADCYGFTEDLDGRVLRVVDLKMGRKAVNPESNKQAALYGAGVLESLYPLLLPRNARVVFTIFQPRLSYKPFSWETSVGWIEDTAMSMRPAARAAIAYKQGTITPEQALSFPEHSGGHCHYCRRKTKCVTFQKELTALATPGQTVKWNPMLFEMRDAIKGYLEDMGQLALDEAIRGNPLPGTKLVRGRAGAAQLCADESVIRAKAKELGIEASVVAMKEVWATPAKIRDAFKRVGLPAAEMANIIKTPEGKLQIAGANDPRDAVVIQTADENSFAGVART